MIELNPEQESRLSALAHHEGMERAQLARQFIVGSLEANETAQASAVTYFDRLRELGNEDEMTMQEIDAEVKAYRREKAVRDKEGSKD